jgi:hypothetical protein
MNAACRGGTSAANDAANLSRSRNRKPSYGGRIGGTRRTRRRVGDQATDRLALVRCEGGDVDEPDDARVHARLGNDCAAVGVADEDGGTLLPVEHVVRRRDVALERERLVLHDAHVEVVGPQQVVDTLPA